MSDLISRSALLEAIRNITYNGCDADTLYEEIKEIIGEQPTAYDVDAVVESIEVLPQQDFLGVAHIPRTAALNRIERGGNCELPEV